MPAGRSTPNCSQHRSSHYRHQINFRWTKRGDFKAEQSGDPAIGPINANDNNTSDIPTVLIDQLSP
jgi:hypothetical protein